MAPTVRFGHAASPWCLGNAVAHKSWDPGPDLIKFIKAPGQDLRSERGESFADILHGSLGRACLAPQLCAAFGQTPEATWARVRSIPPAASSGSCNYLMTMRHEIQL